MSYTCLLMVLCECACANLISKANFNLINRTDLFICLHIMFQISFQNSKVQKNIASFRVFGQNFCLVYIKNKDFQTIKSITLNMFSSAPSLTKLIQSNCFFFSTFIEINLSRESILLTFLEQ